MAAKNKLGGKWSNMVPSKYKWFHRGIISIYFCSLFILIFKIIEYQITVNNSLNLEPEQLMLLKITGAGLIGGLLVSVLSFYQIYLLPKAIPPLILI